MAAIFGPEVRAGGAPPPPTALVPVPLRRRPGWRGPAIAAALTAAVGGGVLAGVNAFGGAGAPPATPAVRAPSLTHPHSGPTPAAGAPMESATEAPAGPAPVIAEAPPSITVAPPGTAGAPVASATSAPAPTPTVAEREPTHPPAPAPSPTSLTVATRAIAPQPAPVVARPAPPAAQDAPSSAPAAPRQGTCDDDPDACLAARVYAADRRVANAFQQAAAAGVKPRTLREYRSEWDRARGEAVDRPGYALRIYGEIASDLYNLAEDAAARDDGP